MSLAYEGGDRQLVAVSTVGRGSREVRERLADLDERAMRWLLG